MSTHPLLGAEATLDDPALLRRHLSFARQQLQEQRNLATYEGAHSFALVQEVEQLQYTNRVYRMKLQQLEGWKRETEDKMRDIEDAIDTLMEQRRAESGRAEWMTRLEEENRRLREEVGKLRMNKEATCDRKSIGSEKYGGDHDEDGDDSKDYWKWGNVQVAVVLEDEEAGDGLREDLTCCESVMRRVDFSGRGHAGQGIAVDGKVLHGVVGILGSGLRASPGQEEYGGGGGGGQAEVD